MSKLSWERAGQPLDSLSLGGTRTKGSHSLDWHLGLMPGQALVEGPPTQAPAEQGGLNFWPPGTTWSTSHGGGGGGVLGRPGALIANLTLANPDLSDDHVGTQVHAHHSRSVGTDLCQVPNAHIL